MSLKLNFDQNPVDLFIENLFIAHQYVMDVHLLLRYEGNYITSSYKNFHSNSQSPIYIESTIRLKVPKHLKNIVF